MSTDERIEAVFSDVFGLDVSVIRNARDFFDLEGWSSLSQMRLLAALESEFGIVFGNEDLGFLRDVDGVRSRIDAKLHG